MNQRDISRTHTWYRDCSAHRTQCCDLSTTIRYDGLQLASGTQARYILAQPALVEFPTPRHHNVCLPPYT